MKKNIMSLTVVILIAVTPLASASNSCVGPTTREIEECSKDNYLEADTDLNKQYKHALDTINKFNAQDLRGIQRLWLAYRDYYCQQAFDQTYPGEEATIDKWECLRRTTVFRTREIEYITKSYSMDEFNQSISLMAEIYEKNDFTRVLDKLIYQISGADEKHWSAYRTANCGMAKRVLGEGDKHCHARMNFYKKW